MSYLNHTYSRFSVEELSIQNIFKGIEHSQIEIGYGREARLYIASVDDILKYCSVKEAYKCLDEEEKDSCERIKCDNRYQEYVLGRVMAKSAIAAELKKRRSDVKFKKNKHGKPFIQNASSNIHFNLSHSNQYFALCVSEDSEVGVDIEVVGNTFARQIPAIAKRNFTQLESELITSTQASEREYQFLRMWTCKEAALKSIGIGLSAPMSCVDTMELDMSDSVSVQFDGELQKVFLRHWFNRAKGFHLALAKVGDPSVVKFSNINRCFDSANVMTSH